MLITKTETEQEVAYIFDKQRSNWQHSDDIFILIENILYFILKI